MIIKWNFADGTESEVEVSEELGAVIVDLDRQEYNIDHKETRRHCSLEAYNLDGNLIPSNEDMEDDFFKEEEYRHLYASIEKLRPRFKYLIVEVCLKERMLKDVAAELGITPASAHESLGRAKKSLKKFLEKP